ncbi:MAG: hypothetical protein KDA46_09605 [Parvularculaceae bacterium]|nr:hypothetical protein [Parvularculaceae bacterium]
MAGCSNENRAAAEFSLQACRRVALADSITGAAIVGAEDLAPDVRAGRLYVSAYDRRAVEAAVKVNAHELPQGGVYSVEIAELASGAPSVTATPLAPVDAIPGGLRPHGLTYDDELGEIIFINRAYVKSGDKWVMQPRVERINVDGAAVVGDAGSPPCAANDIVTIGDATFVSFDHAACGGGAIVENLFGFKRSGVADIHGAPIFSHALFANGVLALSEDRLILAATREKALLVLEKDNKNDWRVTRRIKLPGAPDNLTRAADGAVVVALHPSLWRAGAHRRLGWRRAPSRIVKTTLANGDAQLLFDDPRGTLFSAATAAAVADDLLVAGSATDSGLLVCQKDMSQL